MATLPFPVESLPAEVEVEPLPASLARLALKRPDSSRYAPAPDAAAWPRPTADSWEWLRVRVYSVQEMTCTECGETTIEAYCIRCGRPASDGRIIAKRTMLVRTVDYLHEGEYEIK